MIAVQELRQHIVDPSVGSADDALLMEYEAAAIAHMERGLGHYFGPPKEFVEILPGQWYAPLWLKEAPLEGLEYPFTLEKRTELGGAWEEVPEDEYELIAGTGQIIPFQPLPVWYGGLRATYWAGYELDDEPGDVRQCVRHLVAGMYERRSADPAAAEDAFVRKVIAMARRNRV